MNEPIETQIQPPIVTGAERPYTLADACIDHAKRILIHAQTCPEHVLTLQQTCAALMNQDGRSMRIFCVNCGGAEPLPIPSDFAEAWRARAADDTAIIKAKILRGNDLFSKSQQDVSSGS